MDKKEVHKIIDKYFSNQKHYVFDVFSIEDIDELVPYIKRGYKIPVKFRGEIKIDRRGLSDKEIYNALLEYLADKYSSEEEIKEKIEEWKRGTILHFV